ncbi:hypothetical protein MPER_06085 [Moniliophthora perniciosa FA553]|nr:hypothetical protein MPER_06085 [Moniliophthora perniciosa FA553]
MFLIEEGSVANLVLSEIKGGGMRLQILSENIPRSDTRDGHIHRDSEGRVYELILPVTKHDAKAGPQDRAHLESEIRKAHVICVVYSIDNPNSFDRIPAFWLPHFRQLGVNVPVILVGNKIDLRGGEVTNEALEDEIVPIMNEFKEVETCVECSAKIPLNVSEVFYFAQKAVLHPTAPLYDSRDHVLKPACVKALKRIFKLCDMNKDGILDPCGA